MYHSITFRTSSDTDYNTWSNWHMIPASRPVITHPEMVITTVQIPGKSGSIDLTNYLYNKPIYKNRSGSFDFYVMEGYNDYRTTKMEILKVLHGQKVKMIFEDDPNYYYVCTIKVDKWINEASRPSVTISYTAEPYKYQLSDDKRITNDF